MDTGFIKHFWGFYFIKIKKSSLWKVKFIGLLFMILFADVMNNIVTAQDGKALFRNKCMICHGVTKAIVGPPLKGVEERVPDKKLLYDWIRNNKKVLAKGNSAYFNDLYIKWNKVPMNIFESLTDADIDAILQYVRETAIKEEAAVNIQAGEEEKFNGKYKYLLLIVGILVAGVALCWLLKKSRYKKTE